MTEAPSNTSNHQRVNEMLSHLTPKGALIPYNLTFDESGALWVASKGGLYKISSDGKNVLFESKNAFHKKMAPYCQVLNYQDKIIWVQCEDKADLTEFRVLDLDGNVKHESFIDGKIQSLVIASSGDLYLTKQPPKGSEDFFIYKTHIDAPIGWDEFVEADDKAFQSLCLLDDRHLIAAVTSVPTNIYSRQSLVIIDTESGNILTTFSVQGKEEGQIYFPRSIQRYQDGILVLDKTGRIQKFDREGKYLELAARIDSYVGNGFVVRDDEAVIACSGIVLGTDGESFCDDWIEPIKLDGSVWTA
uniref:SGL domain-containing protein n=1 Tax=Panagrellus redivivus TaxID=6233 RepID=A0A7E4WDK0_PANRE